MTEDSQAISQCQAGDADAFRPLVERYEREAVGHALAIVGNREDAFDAVQAAFVDAFRAIERFDLNREFYPWFYTILRNRCFKLLQQRKRRPETVELTDATSEIVVTSQSARDRMAEVNEALSDLNAEDREIILLKHVDGLTCDELAARLEIPAGTVMSRLYHARRRLREKLT